MRRLILDSDVLLFGFGAPHRWQAHTKRIIVAAERRELELHLSVEALQEFLFHRMRRTPRGLALAQLRTVEDIAHAHPFDAAVWQRTRHLIATTSIRGRDAIHAATALEHGFTEIVTGDEAFAAVPGLTPVTPDRLNL
ncbi:MAG: type II toxin-antitoxin system VapC family toxin [Nocardioides sp.]